ncbi:MAG: helix-turn-helix domain-containing protein [Spirochaetota bacterium]|nr:helix-turn-helix domain-containing protein [Spirochaetota bacterium]
MLEEKKYRPKEVATLLHCHVSTIWRWIDEGILPALKTPTGRYFILQSDIQKYLEKCKKNGEYKPYLN